jgi:hypothetical protein
MVGFDDILSGLIRDSNLKYSRVRSIGGSFLGCVGICGGLRRFLRGFQLYAELFAKIQ